MRKIQLFANVNPLAPNCYLCVENSDQFGPGSSFRYEKEILPKSKAKLKELGFKYYTVTTEETYEKI